MEKKILLIDDNDISDTLEAIEDDCVGDSDLEFKVKCLPWFNPVDRKFLNDDNTTINLELSRQHLIEEYLGDKIDVIGCDFNLHSENKTLAFEIIETIRQLNKSATLFIYSGGMNRSTLQLFSEEGKKPGERYLKIAMTSNISAYINNRNAIAERVVEMIKQPSIELQIEDYLMQNQSLTLSHYLEEFKGKQFFEISKEVRIQSEAGVRFTKEFIERGISHIVDLNID